MRYHALCCDYDGTLARHGQLADSTVRSLERLIASGRRLVLVTGRQLPELKEVCPRLDLFTYVVAENGGLLYRPETREEKPLAAPPPESFLAALRARRVAPLAVGRVVVATWEPHETDVLAAIRDLGLELEVIFNKGAVMVLPAGTNKATGLKCALEAMGLSPRNTVGVGDAENDHAFLALCECAVAVANALPAVKQHADIVTQGSHGEGVSELIEEMITDDLAHRDARLARHHILLGRDEHGTEVRIPPHGSNLLLCGTSGGGKSQFAAGFLERLAGAGYTYCALDPEGDYEVLPGALTLGTPQRAPSIEELVQVFADPARSAVLNLVAVSLEDRPAYLLGLLPRLAELRARTARPHWIAIDEAHHLLPAAWEAGAPVLPDQVEDVLAITVHPRTIAPQALRAVDVVVIFGAEPDALLHEICDVIGCPTPTAGVDGALETGEALVWFRRSGAHPVRIKIAPTHVQRRRHIRKYAEGTLGPDRSFYFRGPEGRTNLRAQNLAIFMQLADGVDDATWTYHLQRGDYSRWMRESIKEDALAATLCEIEQRRELSPCESRRQVREAIARLYTLPADASATSSSDPA